MTICVPPLSFDEAEGEIEILKCNGVEYSVHGDYFAEISPLYAEIQQTKKNSLYLKCSNESFQQFINACQKLPFSVNIFSIDELILLSQIFKIPKLTQILETLKPQIMEQKLMFDEISSKIHQLSKLCDRQQQEINELKKKQNSHFPIPRASSGCLPELSSIVQQDSCPNSSTPPPVPAKQAVEAAKESVIKQIDFNGKPMKGVFFWLRQQTQETLVAAKLVKVTVSSTNYLSSNPDDIVENSRMCRWLSHAKKRSWVKIDLMNHVLTVNAYTIRLPEANSMLWIPRSWTLEGSTDDISWTVIDEQRDNKIFAENVSICTWTVTPSGPFRYLKLTQTQSNREFDNYFILCAIEFFGVIQKRPEIFG